MDAYSKQKPGSVQALFGSIAKRYDRVNAILSFQLHHLWNRRLIKAVLKSDKPYIAADLCCGTGDIALTWLKKTALAQEAYLIDFCPEILDCARIKANALNLERHHIKYLSADVQKIPLKDQSVDFATIAYGIRNVENPMSCFSEAKRIIKKGGRLGILELTEPDNACLRLGHRFYLKYFLPLIGKMMTSNKAAYEYLSQSIKEFMKPNELALQLEECGFSQIQIQKYTGGIVTLITATVPP